MKSKWERNSLEHTNVVFKTYWGESIHALGKVKILVHYHDQKELLNLHVIEGNKPSLIRRDWLYNLGLNWHEIFSIRDDGRQKLEEFEEIFGSDLGILKGEKAKIYLKDNVKPKFCKACPVPYALKQKIEN